MKDCYLCDVEALPTKTVRQIIVYKMEKSDLLKRKYRGKRLPGRINRQIKRLQLKEPRNKVQIMGMPEKAALELFGRPVENNVVFDQPIWPKGLKIIPFHRLNKVKL